MTKGFWRAAAAAASTMLVLAAAPAPVRAADEQKIRVAVVDFDTEALEGSWSYGWSYTNLARCAADNLTSELVKTGRFRMVERQKLDKILQEQNLAESGRIDPSTAAKLGKILGVQLVVIGAVTEFNVNETGGNVPQIGSWKGLGGVGFRMITGKAALTARLVDTTTAEILGAYDGAGSYRFGKGEFAGASLGTEWNSGMASKILSGAVQALAKDIAARSANLAPAAVRGGVEGKIAKVEGGKIYLNVGDAAGVKVGDRFVVHHLGEQIKDPDTGELLGGDESEVGEVEVVRILGARLAEARAASGAGFQAGDRIRMK